MPDFSGTWEADLAKSRFLGQAAERIVVEITHREPKLIQTVTTTNGSAEERVQFCLRRMAERASIRFVVR